MAANMAADVASNMAGVFDAAAAAAGGGFPGCMHADFFGGAAAGGGSSRSVPVTTPGSSSSSSRAVPPYGSSGGGGWWGLRQRFLSLFGRAGGGSESKDELSSALMDLSEDIMAQVSVFKNGFLYRHKQSEICPSHTLGCLTHTCCVVYPATSRMT
jgi:hypothetical protein